MPYIPQQRRRELGRVLDALCEANVKADGDLSFILFSLARHLTPSYGTYKNFLGEINEAAEEIRRRLLAPYEDEKRKLNGDI